MNRRRRRICERSALETQANRSPRCRRLDDLALLRELDQLSRCQGSSACPDLLHERGVLFVSPVQQLAWADGFARPPHLKQVQDASAVVRSSHADESGERVAAWACPRHATPKVVNTSHSSSAGNESGLARCRGTVAKRAVRNKTNPHAPTDSVVGERPTANGLQICPDARRASLNSASRLRRSA